MAGWASSAVSAISGIAGSAVSAISGCAVSYVVQRIVDRSISYLQRRVMPVDSETELERLRTALPQIKSVMGIAEALKAKDPTCGEWFKKFRRAVDASEDVLDELDYKELEDMVLNQDEAGGSAPQPKKQKSCLVDEDTLGRLREAVRMLDQAIADVDCLRQRATELGIQGFSETWQEASKFLRPETTSFLAEKKVVGRDDEKRKIIGWLKRSTEEPLSVFGIIGMGGLGKTTLAQLAYQEMKESDYFDHTIWICVSIEFSFDGLTRKILGELGKNNGGDNPFNALQETLKKEIQSKKIFLVLDDVWDDENWQNWEQFIAPLRFAQEGSKILFTTRMKSVSDLLARVISTKHDSLILQGLKEQELRSVFYNYAFHGYNPEDHQDLVMFGDQIIKMLRGSPLAAKVIGCLLNTHMDYNFWGRILKQGSLFNIDQAKNVVEVLKLSYYHLPTDLQVCFRFCSIFPQDYEFEKDELIKMWIAVGFIQQQQCQEKWPEDVGEDYFNHLLRKSFFEYIKVLDKYIMHDLVHELAENVSSGECYRVEPNGKHDVIPSSIRHISVVANEIERVSHLENLHSLVITASPERGVDPDPLFLSDKIIKKSLRLLRIDADGSCHLSEGINYLVHLRYLSIPKRYTSPRKCLIPASVHKLYQLQVLDLSGVHPDSPYLGIEPSRINNLVRLQYMMLPMEILKTIPGLRKLTSLQKLTFYVGRESGHCINELLMLNNLRDLSICNIENVGDPVEAKSANLLGKKNLRSLHLKWSLESNPNNPEQIIDNLQPIPSLIQLRIENYKGQRSPSWMENSPPLESVQELLDSPVWKDDQHVCQMAVLKVLVISNCPNMDKLSDIPLPLIKFRVEKVGLTSLPNFCKNSGGNTSPVVSQKSSLKTVEIIGCKDLISLNGFLQQANIDLQGIENLTIMNCEKLMYLPSQGFGNLTSLKYLDISDCPNLVVMDFHADLLSRTLEKFYMKNCGALEMELLKATSHLITLTRMDVSNCANITSFSASGQYMFISSCDELAEVSFVVGANGMDKEKKANIFSFLHIYNCPKLTRCHNLPLTVVQFDISNVAVSSLPEYSRNSESSGSPSMTSLRSSLISVQIMNCPNLISLNGFLQQGYIDFQYLKYMDIQDCKNLVQLPEGGFMKFVSLENLSIGGCPMLMAVDNHDNLLPMTLKRLSIKCCGELEMQLLESASRLINLNHLQIEGCANVSHIPCSENAFRSLSTLVIYECDRLIEHSLREQANGINLQGSSNLVSLKINDLSIDHLSLLLIEPLRSLRFVKSLTITNCLGMDAFSEKWYLQNRSTLRELRIEEATILKSLPATIAMFTAITELVIFNCFSLEEIQELPASLRILRIYGANSLKSLPSTMASLTALEELTILRADLLVELPKLPPSLKIKFIQNSKGEDLFWLYLLLDHADKTKFQLDF